MLIVLLFIFFELNFLSRHSLHSYPTSVIDCPVYKKVLFWCSLSQMSVVFYSWQSTTRPALKLGLHPWSSMRALLFHYLVILITKGGISKHTSQWTHPHRASVRMQAPEVASRELMFCKGFKSHKVAWHSWGKAYRSLLRQRASHCTWASFWHVCTHWQLCTQPDDWSGKSRESHIFAVMLTVLSSCFRASAGVL